MTNKLIAVESIDGAGGTTVTNALADELELTQTFEPWFHAYRDELDEHGNDMSAIEQTFTFLKDRAYHQDQIASWLSEGHVVCDRYIGSTVAYQAPQIRDECDMIWKEAIQYVDELHDPWCRRPDITLYIDVYPYDIEKRLDGDVFEDTQTQIDACDYYNTYYRHKDIVWVDGYQDKDEMCDEAVTKVAERL